jgi:hypothetical protein
MQSLFKALCRREFLSLPGSRNDEMMPLGDPNDETQFLEGKKIQQRKLYKKCRRRNTSRAARVIRRKIMPDSLRWTRCAPRNLSLRCRGTTWTHHRLDSPTTYRCSRMEITTVKDVFLVGKKVENLMKIPGRQKR